MLSMTEKDMVLQIMHFDPPYGSSLFMGIHQLAYLVLP